MSSFNFGSSPFTQSGNDGFSFGSSPFTQSGNDGFAVGSSPFTQSGNNGFSFGASVSLRPPTSITRNSRSLRTSPYERTRETPFGRVPMPVYSHNYRSEANRADGSRDIDESSFGKFSVHQGHSFGTNGYDTHHHSAFGNDARSAHYEEIIKNMHADYEHRIQQLSAHYEAIIASMRSDDRK